eukprot:sb/3460909/
MADSQGGTVMSNPNNSEATSSRDQARMREAMAAFAGGQRSATINQNNWNKKFQTMRANKLKTSVVDQNRQNTGNLDRTRRPGAMTMMKDFYTGYKNEPSKQPIRTLYLGHVTGFQPIRDQYFLIRSVPGRSQYRYSALSYQNTLVTAIECNLPYTALYTYLAAQDLTRFSCKVPHRYFFSALSTTYTTASDISHADLSTVNGEFPVLVFRRTKVTSLTLISVEENFMRSHEAVSSGPYFTSWVMFVNIVILIITLATQSIAPIGFTDKLITRQLLRHNLAYETVGYNQTTNFWIGPDFQSLIHLGAKYAPCMRKDQEWFDSIDRDTVTEDKGGCCVRNDLNVCWQTQATDCTSTFATFYDDKRYLTLMADMYTGHPDLPGKTLSPSIPDVLTLRTATKPSGREVTQPGLTALFTVDQPLVDVISEENRGNATMPTLACEVSARPCCVGLQGECLIISQEECEFRQGFFHEENTLCSQVSCITEICGLSGFLFDDIPDQFYRALLPTFMHAGVVHLLITLVFQATILRDQEKFAGWWRIGFIYMSSGIGGTMLSAILIPYMPEVGASGALYGILASLLVEVAVNWKIYKNPCIELTKLLLLLAILFLVGLLPWIDNFAHIGGFVFGFLTAFVVLPHINYSDEDRIAKLVVQIVCGILAVVLFALLFIVFYLAQGSECENCTYLNCIPFTESFCQDATMNLRPRDCKQSHSQVSPNGRDSTVPDHPFGITTRSADRLLSVVGKRIRVRTFARRSLYGGAIPHLILRQCAQMGSAAPDRDRSKCVRPIKKMSDLDPIKGTNSTEDYGSTNNNIDKPTDKPTDKSTDTTDNPTYTVQEALNHAGVGHGTVIPIFCALITQVTKEAENTVLAISGGVAGGHLITRFGRLYNIIIFTFLSSIAAIASGMAASFVQFLVFRGITVLFLEIASSASTIYSVEYSPVWTRPYVILRLNSWAIAVDHVILIVVHRMEAMAAFAGGQRSATINQNNWNKKFQTMRANKLKTSVVDQNRQNTGNLDRTWRPGAMTMMKDFYTGETDVGDDPARNLGEGFLADLMDREYKTLSKLPPEKWEKIAFFGVFWVFFQFSETGAGLHDFSRTVTTFGEVFPNSYNRNWRRTAKKMLNYPGARRAFDIEATSSMDQARMREAMAAFAGGQRSATINQNNWNKKFQTMRANKLKTSVVDQNRQNTGNLDRTRRPGAMTMMKDFYTGYKNPETRDQTLRHGRAVSKKSNFDTGKGGFFGTEEGGQTSGGKVETDVGDDPARNLGEGFLADLMDREYKTLSKLPPEHRQIRICGRRRLDGLITRQLLRHNLAYETVGYNQTTNFWIGPDFQSLIHLGAKYAPCMRKDQEWFDSIDRDTVTCPKRFECVLADTGNRLCVDWMRQDVLTLRTATKHFGREVTRPGLTARLEQCTCNAEVVGSSPALARYFSNFPPYLILNRSHSLIFNQTILPTP